MPTTKSYNKVLILVLYLLFACSTSPSQAQTVYVTKTGKKYHLESCRYLKYSKNPIDLSQAIEKGYTSCGICKPDAHIQHDHAVVNDSSTSSEPSEEYAPVKSTTAQQCAATTRAGNRCKRRTKNANGKCWQHQ